MCEDEGTVDPVQAVREYEAHRYEEEVSGQLQGPAALPPGKEKGVVVSQSRS